MRYFAVIGGVACIAFAIVLAFNNQGQAAVGWALAGLFSLLYAEIAKDVLT